MILTINERCRLESDRYQWAVQVPSGADWRSLHFWERLDQALDDCVAEKLAKATDILAFDRERGMIAAAEARLQEAPGAETPSLPKGLTIASDWYIVMHEDHERYNLYRGDPADTRDIGGRVAAGNGHAPYGNYKGLRKALIDCLHYRLRLSESLDAWAEISAQAVKAGEVAASGYRSRPSCGVTGALQIQGNG